ncbi:uncharacterized, partial [Tachysurus ichikawai]
KKKQWCEQNSSKAVFLSQRPAEPLWSVA